LSLPLAKLANSRGWLRTGVTTTSGLMYAIPSLPLFVLLPGLVGTGVRSPLNIAVALSLYGLALMVPTASDAFRSVSRDVLGSATAQGYAPAARFLRVELPLAGPVLLAGVRVVAGGASSLVAVGGVLGGPSLGMLVVRGVRCVPGRGWSRRPPRRGARSAACAACRAGGCCSWTACAAASSRRSPRASSPPPPSPCSPMRCLCCWDAP